MGKIIRVLVVLILAGAVGFTVRLAACSAAPETLEKQESGLEDPTYTDFVSDNGQVSLLGAYIDQSQSTNDNVVLYVAFGVKARPGAATNTIDSYTGGSFARFLALENAEYTDTTAQSSAEAFGKIGYKTASYNYNATVKGAELKEREATKVVAVFNLSRMYLSRTSNLSLWLDACEAVRNEPSAAIGYTNVILSFPSNAIRTYASEADIVAKLK